MDTELQTGAPAQTYQVIARKWRPQNFSDLIGQEHIATTLLNAIRNNRLPQALIFNGVRGTGKTSSARILAKALRCQNPRDFEPCGLCSDCIDISASRSVDVIEIDGASNNGVDSIRDLRDAVNYKPATGRYKVYIIDEVHMLSTAAFNALLKTLEEPPQHVVFVLATTEVQKIPSTILSRAQRFEFRRIPSRRIAEHLEHICRAEGFQAENDALWLIARKADGSMRDSQSLLDQAITFSDGHLSTEKLSDILGLTTRTLILEAVDSLIQRAPKQIVSVVEKLNLTGVDPRIFATELLEEVRNALVLKVANEARDPSTQSFSSLVDLPDSEIAHLTRSISTVSVEDLHLLFDILLKGINDLTKSTMPQLVLEMVLFRAASAPTLKSLADLFSLSSNRPPDPEGERVLQKAQPPLNVRQRAESRGHTDSGRSNQLETRKANQPNSNDDHTLTHEPRSSSESPRQDTEPKYTLDSFVKRLKPASKSTEGASKRLSSQGLAATSPDPSMASPRAAQSADVEPTDPWQSFVYRVRKSNGLLGAMLENTHIVSQSETSLTLGVPKKVSFVIDKMKEPENIKRIQQFISTLWGKSLDVQIIAGEPDGSGSKSSLVREELTPRAQEKKREIEKQKTIESTVEQNPLVRSARDIFRGQIKQIKNPE